MAETRDKKLMLWLKQLETVKNEYEDLFYDIARYVNPRRELVKDSQRFDEKGHRRGKSAYDGTPNGALNIWADGMQGFLVAQNLRWFKSELSDHTLNDVDEVRTFLQEYDEAMYAAFRRGNFYSILGEWFRDAGSVGTATLYTEEDMANRSAVHLPIHLREVFIAENMQHQVDVLFRKFMLTARQAVQMFDNDKLHPTIVTNAKEHPEKPHEFVHVVYPNDEFMFGGVASTQKRYRSTYMQMEKSFERPEDGLIVREGGYDIFPYAVWRYRKNSDEIYGYSPATDAIVEIYTLNQLGKDMLTAAHKAVDPPLNVPLHMRGHVRMDPKGYNYYQNHQEIISPINTGTNFQFGIDREERLQRSIEDKYRVEFFLVLARSTREMTATEIMERQAEKAVLMGPQVDRLITEGLSKVFDIVSDIEDRAGRLPEPPPILQDMPDAEITIRFTGPLAQAQRRLFKMQPIKNGLNELAQASVLKPDIIDGVKWDDTGREILESADFPQHLMNSPAEIAEIRAARAADAQRQQAMEQLSAAADAYPKVAKKAEEGSPAAQLQEAVGAA